MDHSSRSRLLTMVLQYRGGGQNNMNTVQYSYILFVLYLHTEAIGGCFGRRTGQNSVGNYSGPLWIYSAKDWSCFKSKRWPNILFINQYVNINKLRIFVRCSYYFVNLLYIYWSAGTRPARAKCSKNIFSSYGEIVKFVRSPKLSPGTVTVCCVHVQCTFCMYVFPCEFIYFPIRLRYFIYIVYVCVCTNLSNPREIIFCRIVRYTVA
jgi:hypothetical protein